MKHIKVCIVTLLFLCLLSLIPEGFARTLTTVQPPYNFSWATAWRGDHWPQRETWDARATADVISGVMESYIYCYMDVGGYLNVYFETGMGEFFTYVGPEGNTITMTLSSLIHLCGHAHLYGISFLFGAYTTAWYVHLWMIVHDYTTGEDILNLKIKEWEDSEIGGATWLTDRGYNWNEDSLVPATSIAIEAGHSYSVIILLAAGTGVSVAGLAACQSTIDFETDDYFTKVKSITFDYDIPYEYGDVIDDDVVDMRDISLVASAYGSRQGDPNWNPLADINKDGIVDIRDISIVARNYGSQIIIG